MTVTVRFAPSATGNIHIGNARTALFNWAVRTEARRSALCCASPLLISAL